MKIAIIARGRTNSTAIGKTLAHRNGCEWVGEEYFWHIQEYSNWLTYRPKYNKVLAFEEFKEIIHSFTNTLSLKDNIVTKFFPSILYFPPYFIHENNTLNNVKQNFIFNLDILNLNQYDKFYILDRNLLDSVTSWVYAHKSVTFHNHKIHKRQYYKLTLEKNDFARAKFYILEYFMQHKIKNYLDEHKKTYTYINESSYDQYIDTDFLSTEKTEIDYKNYITNIDELKEFVNHWYPIIEKQTTDWNFT